MKKKLLLDADWIRVVKGKCYVKMVKVNISFELTELHYKEN